MPDMRVATVLCGLDADMSSVSSLSERRRRGRFVSELDREYSAGGGLQAQHHGKAHAAALRQAHVWTAPAVQEEFGVDAKWGASHVFGLLLRH
jgi:hypothetical protein